MMLDIMICVTFLPGQNKYPATRFIFQKFDKNGILIIKRLKELTILSVISGNILYHLMWQMIIDIIMLITFFPLQNKYSVTRFLCSNRKDIDNQKVQETNEIKRESRNIWYLLTWQMMLDIISCI